MAFYFFFQRSVAHYELIADVGTGVASGQFVSLLQERFVDAIGTMAIAQGQSGSLSFTRSLTGEMGTVQAQGQSVALKQHYPLHVFAGMGIAAGQIVAPVQSRSLAAVSGMASGQGEHVIFLHTITAAVSTDKERIAAIKRDYRIIPIETDDRVFDIPADDRNFVVV